MSSFKMIFASAVVAGLVGVTSSPADAHHSAPATYMVDKTIQIEGTVVQFLFRNPHSVLYVVAPNQSGEVVKWAVEWGAAGALADTVKADTLKPGDKVIVTGNPARDTNSSRLLMRGVERPSDGWKWAGTFG